PGRLLRAHHHLTARREAMASVSSGMARRQTTTADALIPRIQPPARPNRGSVSRPATRAATGAAPADEHAAEHHRDEVADHEAASTPPPNGSRLYGHEIPHVSPMFDGRDRGVQAGTDMATSRFEVTTADGEAAVVCSGDLTPGAVPELRTAVQRCLDAGARHVDVDLRGLEGAHPDAVAVLSEVRDLVHAAGGTARLCVDDRVRTLLESARTVMLFEAID